MILSGSAVPVKGLGASQVSARKRLMAARRSTIEHAALKLPLGELGEEALNGVEPAGGCEREVKDPPRM
jgi:hypothetical protein